jgi:hypothetical protein
VTFELDPDQQSDVERMLGNHTWGLFHEQGVGKTPPALVAAGKRLPALITIPAYLGTQWARRCTEWLPGATVQLVNGDGHALRTEQLTSGADVTLVSYNTWAPGKGRPEYPYLWRNKWGSFVLDEGHRIRGYNSQWTQEIHRLRNADAKNRNVPIWSLTGTPYVRDGGDLFPFLKLCNRKRWGSYWTFVETWCHMEYTPWETKIGRLKDPEAFYRMLAEFSWRRELVGQEDAVYVDIPVQLPKSVYDMIRKAKKEFVFEHPDMEEPEWYDAAGAVWQRIRRMVAVPPTAVKPKLDAMVGTLEDIPRDRVIVYCWYRDTAKACLERIGKMRSALTGKPRPVALFTGDVTTRGKIAAIQQYDDNPDGVIVATIAALKEGADLQSGHHAVFVEESVLGEENMQAIGRQRRRGQLHPVVVHRIRADRSIDHAVRKLAEARTEDARSLMDEYLRGSGEYE